MTGLQVAGWEAEAAETNKHLSKRFLYNMQKKCILAKTLASETRRAEGF